MAAEITEKTYNEVAHIVGYLSKEEFLHFNKKYNSKIKFYYKLCNNRQILKTQIEKLLLQNKPLN